MRGTLGLALITMTAACGGPSSQAVTVRDSAGVAIVASRAPAWEAGGGWRLASSPALDIGVLDGAPEYQLDNVAGVVRGQDGSIVVADGGSGEVRTFDAGGRFLRKVGGLGDGPGEFAFINAIGRAPDSTWVYDYSQHRFTVFPDGGGAPRIATLRTDIPNLLAVGRLPDGRWVLGESWGSSALRPPPAGGGAAPAGGPPTPEPPREGIRRDPVAYLRFAPDGGDATTLGMFPGREMELRIEGGSGGEGRMMMIALPFARTSTFALHGDRLYIGDQSSFEIGQYDADGRLRRLIRVAAIDLTLTDAEVQAAMEQDLASRPEQYRPGVRAIWESRAMPATKPAYRRFVVDDHGNLWVSEFTIYAVQPTRWTVLDPDGRWLGAVQVPERFRVEWIDDAGVLGVWRDELDVEHVRAYALVK